MPHVGDVAIEAAAEALYKAMYGDEAPPTPWRELVEVEIGQQTVEICRRNARVALESAAAVAPPPSRADQAVAHIIDRMQADDRVAYQLGWGTRSFELLTAAYAEARGVDLADYREQLRAALTPSPAHCMRA